MSFKGARLMGTLIMIVVMSFVMLGLMSYDTLNALANTTSSGKTIHELEKSLEDAKSAEKKLKSQAAEAASKAASYQAEISRLDGEISNLTEQLTLIESLTEEWKRDSEETKEKITTLEAQKADEISAFESMLRISYQYGSDTYFNLIFGSEDIGDFLSRTDLIGYHLKANDNILDSLTATLSDLEAANERYEKSIGKIEEYSLEQTALKSELEEKSEYARRKKQEYEADEEKYKSELSAKTAEMASMEAEIKAYYEEQRRNGNTQTYEGGTFFMPVPARSYRISSEFENRISPITGKHENHNGIDFAAPAGTSIYAAADGTVIDSRYSSSWGNVVQIDHGGGLITLYAHCSYRGVQKGQTVSKGQLIAKVGSTGWSTGNHLHFGISVGGTYVNPLNYVSR